MTKQVHSNANDTRTQIRLSKCGFAAYAAFGMIYGTIGLPVVFGRYAVYKMTDCYY